MRSARHVCQRLRDLGHVGSRHAVRFHAEAAPETPTTGDENLSVGRTGITGQPRHHRRNRFRCQTGCYLWSEVASSHLRSAIGRNRVDAHASAGAFRRE